MELTTLVRKAPHVMLVEDDDTLSVLLCYNICAAGCTVELINSGQDALNRALHTPPDVIVLDWMLPELSGIEVLRQLRQSPRGVLIPIVMLTARTEPSDRVRALKLGADAFVTKPFSISTFIAILNQLVAVDGGETLLRASK